MLAYPLLHTSEDKAVSSRDHNILAKVRSYQVTYSQSRVLLAFNIFFIYLFILTGDGKFHELSKTSTELFIFLHSFKALKMADHFPSNFQRP